MTEVEDVSSQLTSPNDAMINFKLFLIRRDYATFRTHAVGMERVLVANLVASSFS